MATKTRIPEWILKDRELGPGVWLLTRPLVADKAARFLDLLATYRNDVVKWEKLHDAQRAWSSGERIFAELALHFWTGNELPHVAQPYRWGAALGSNHQHWILDAIAIAWGLPFDQDEAEQE